MTETNRLEGKTAVVVGGGAHSTRVLGIGETTCLRLAEEGADIIVADKQRAMAERTAAEIEEDCNSNVIAHEVDITVEEELASLKERVEDEFGQLDVLVNNAGVRVDPNPVTEANRESWDRTLEINLRGIGETCKHLIPLMAADEGGSIINISSANAIFGRRNWAQYDASKAGLLALTRDMAADHAADDIRVNALLPGPTVTDYHIENVDTEDPDVFIEEQTQRHEDGPGILKRWGHPRELANGVLFLASEESSFVTGSTITVDGGLTAAGYDV